jgi:hydroxymethylpyrimidine/phosphomethylpyrimidine kinase
LAEVVTPNIAEAEVLIDVKIRSLEDMRAAAGEIFQRYNCGALVKGGHLPGTREAVDIYHGPEGEWMLSAPRVAHAKLHGTGCTYSAAITAWLAHGKSKVKALELAKEFITQRILSSTP